MESRPPQATEGHELYPVLTALTDDDCRAIVESLSSPMSAQEISDTCDIPLSTTYRKVNMLAEADLLEERIDVRRGSKHTKRYEPKFESVNISLTEEGKLSIDIETGESEPDRRLGRAWGEVRQEI